MKNRINSLDEQQVRILIEEFFGAVKSRNSSELREMLSEQVRYRTNEVSARGIYDRNDVCDVLLHWIEDKIVTRPALPLYKVLCNEFRATAWGTTLILCGREKVENTTFSFDCIRADGIWRITYISIISEKREIPYRCDEGHYTWEDLENSPSEFMLCHLNGNYTDYRRDNLRVIKLSEHPELPYREEMVISKGPNGKIVTMGQIVMSEGA